jgi:hypothetical protein
MTSERRKEQCRMSESGRIAVAVGLVALSIMSGCRVDGDFVAPSEPSSVAADRSARLGTSATTLTFPFHEPFGFAEFTECVNGGLGEVIEWSGEVSGVREQAARAISLSLVVMPITASAR